MKANKLLALGGLMATGLFINQAASAADLGICGTTSWAIGDLIGNSCTQQDKTFSFISSTLPAGNVQFVLDVLVGVDTHTITYTRADPMGTGTTTLVYDITITPAAISDNFFFKNVSLGRTTTNSPDITTTKDVTNLDNASESHQLTNNTLNPDFFDLEGAWGNDVVGLHVVDTVTINAGNAGSWTGLSNTFQQKNNVVPEPASLALFGLGLAGIAARIRRRDA